MLKKSCAIILSIALAMGILVHSSFAYEYENTDIYSFDDIWGYGVPSVSSLFSSYEAAYDSISEFVTGESNIFMGLSNWNVTFYGLIVYVSESGYFRFYNNRLYLSEPSTSVLYVNGATNQSYVTSTFTSSSSGTSIDGQTYFLVTQYVNFGDLNNSSLFSTVSIYYLNDLLTPYNLELGSLNPDTRQFSVSKWTGGSVPYLGLHTNDMLGWNENAFNNSGMFAIITYEDSLGVWHEMIDCYQMIYYPGDEVNLFAIDPRLISYSQFTVTAVEYWGSSEFGSYIVNDLSLTFNDEPLPSPVPTGSPSSDYNYNNTNIINYNGGQKDIFYNSFQVDLKRYEDVDSQGFFKDSYDYLVQPFAFNFILLPSFVASQGYVYDDFVDDCFYQYDVIMTEYYDSYFDFFYGSGALLSLQAALNGLSSGTDISSYLDTWYAAHSPVVFTFPYPDDSTLVHLSSDMPALLVITDSFYFKQTNYLLGDTGDILSQFSDRFYKVGGFSDVLFGNMASLYNLNLSFFDDVLPQVTNLSYFVNGLRVNEGFDSVVALLTSVDSYVSSVDGKLDYLVTIDSDLNDLLEWFQNQEDSDVVLNLPEFNPSILIEVYGQNIGDLVGFFQDFIDVLPSFDFSDFPNFFDYAADLVDDIAGQDDDVINDLYLPYDYSDSGLHEFGWD